METDIGAVTDQVQDASAFVYRLREEIGKVIVGQRYLVDRLLVGLLANGHVLLEGVPGPGQDAGGQDARAGHRRQLPAHPVHARPAARRPDRHADLQPARRRVHHQARARSSPTSSSPTRSTAPPPRCRARCSRRCRSARSRSATRPSRCPTPFLVLATQNPIEQEGTYPLPEAQVDRFMLKLSVGYPSPRRGAPDPRPHGRPPITALRVAPVVHADDILRMRGAGRQRLPGRQGQGLHRRPGVRDARPGRRTSSTCSAVHPVRRLAARDDLPDPGRQGATRSLHGRGYVTPQDVKSIGRDVLRHRIIVTYEAEAEEMTSDTIVKRIFDGVPVP